MKRIIGAACVAVLGGCAAVDMAVSLPTESTLVFLPNKGGSLDAQRQAKAECEQYASSKVSTAREDRVTKGVLKDVMAIGGGALGGAIVGGSMGIPGATGMGAAIGATGGGTYAGAAGQFNFDSTYQGIFDAWFAKCAEEHGYNVKAPSGAGTMVGVPIR